MGTPKEPYDRVYSVGGCVKHDDVIRWKYFPRYWPFCGEFTGHRWILLTKASDAELWYFLWSAPATNGWVNNRSTCDLRRHRTQHDIIAMDSKCHGCSWHLVGHFEWIARAWLAFQVLILRNNIYISGLILCLRPANNRRRYKLTPSLIGWKQT